MTKKKPASNTVAPSDESLPPVAPAKSDTTSTPVAALATGVAEVMKHTDAPEGWTPSAVWSGSGFLDVLDPDPLKINLAEIARGLARQSRFGPAVLDDYSVAEHSVGCYRIMRAIGMSEGWDPEIRRDLECAALLHDAPEYVLGDMLSPIKKQCPDFQALDATLSRAIEVRFGLPDCILDADVVHHVDKLAGDTEARVFLPAMPAWPGMSDGHPDGICRTTKPASYFLRTAVALGLA